MALHRRARLERRMTRRAGRRRGSTERCSCDSGVPHFGLCCSTFLPLWSRRAPVSAVVDERLEKLGAIFRNRTRSSATAATMIRTAEYRRACERSDGTALIAFRIGQRLSDGCFATARTTRRRCRTAQDASEECVIVAKMTSGAADRSAFSTGCCGVTRDRDRSGPRRRNRPPSNGTSDATRVE